MSALLAAWETLRNAVHTERPSPAHVDHATMALMQLAPVSPPSEIEAVMLQASAVVAEAGLQAAAPIAMSCGALIEQGAPAGPLADALIRRLPEVFAHAAAYADAVEDISRPTEGNEQDGDWVGDAFAPNAWVHARFQSHPDQVVAWHELRRFCLPAIAAATHDRVLLQRFVLRSLGPHLDRLRHLEPHARFLHRLHRILLDAPVRFVDLASRRVFDLRIDAVASNFELHTLILAVLGDTLGQPTPSPEIVACLRGRGARQLLQKSESAWALYSSGAVADLLAGRKAPMDHWIWNESVPADIPVWEGTRVIVATPASFIRDWDTGRTFQALGGTVDLVVELPSAEASKVIAGYASASANFE